MEDLTKDELLELVGSCSANGLSEQSVEQWPEELRVLFEVAVKTPDEAEAFAQQLVQNQNLDQMLADVMTEVTVPSDLGIRVVAALPLATESIDDTELLHARLSEVRDTHGVDQRRRRSSLQIVTALAVMIFGLALWPLVAPDSSGDIDVVQVKQSVEPWIAELDQNDSWDELSGEATAIAGTLQQSLPLGTKVRSTTVGDGQLVLDFSSPRNGKVVVFILSQSDEEVSTPDFEVLQVSGPFAVAMGRVGNLQVVIVTNESMKRIRDFLPG